MNSSIAYGDPAVSDLKGEYRDGQVFLTWCEADTPTGTTFNVYVSPSRISDVNLKAAAMAAHHLEPHSARDWWQDPASFDKKAAPGKPGGFIIESGKPPLDPAMGLFVYTVSKTDPDHLFFAVTATGPDGTEDTRLVPGHNTLETPVVCQAGAIQAIWIGQGAQMARGAGKRMPLVLDLHARGGGIPSKGNRPNFLFFGDASMGWRAGLPFEFTATIQDGVVSIIPNDRAWTGGRRQSEAQDERNDCPAVNTWWFGYNERFYKSALEPKKVLNNYTERWVLGLVHWAQAYFQTDAPATHVCGGSMGGSGAVALCLRHPKEFASAWAEVPMVRFVAQPVRTLNRLEAIGGPIDDSTLAANGQKLMDWVDGVWQAQHNAGDLPYLFILHGRQDPTIPWVMNPSFYQAMLEARQGLSAFWNNYAHNTMSKHLPADVDSWPTLMRKYRLDASFPVFSLNTDNKNFGKGEPADGDLVGWLNRGMDWKDVVDTPRQYAMTLLASHPEISYPVTVTVTFRRLQQFKVSPRQKVSVTIGDRNPGTITADEHGLITVQDVTITDNTGVRIVVIR